MPQVHPPLIAGSGGIVAEMLDSVPESGNLPILVNSSRKMVLPGGTPGTGRALIYGADGSVVWSAGPVALQSELPTRATLGLATTDTPTFSKVYGSGFYNAAPMMAGFRIADNFNSQIISGGGVALQALNVSVDILSGQIRLGSSYDTAVSRGATGPTVDARAAGGFRSRNLANDADAPITASTGTFSGSATTPQLSHPSLLTVGCSASGFANVTQYGPSGVTHYGPHSFISKITTNEGTTFRGGPADPTVSDIPAGVSTLWNNTTTSELKLWANVSGVLKSVLLS